MMAFQADPSKLRLRVLMQVLQRDLATPVADGIIDFPEPAAADRALDGVVIQRPVTMFESIRHESLPSLRYAPD